MDSSRNPLQDFVLTPEQQTLLFAALNTQNPAHRQPTNGLTMSPSTTFEGSPGRQPDGSYDYDFSGAESSLDFSYNENGGARRMGDLLDRQDSSKSETPDNADSESPDKRSHPDDEDDDEAGGAKRRESEDKVPKKPGRKPLTTEPTSKRKAQNRAAQRAFRERKEKHLKDLENKVDELEKVSESATHENKQLRAKIDKLTVELTEYKKRISMLTNYSSVSKPTGGTLNAWYTTLNASNINDVNFQFEFPKFGAPPSARMGTEPQKSLPGSSMAGLKRAEGGQLSPMENAKDAAISSNASPFGHEKNDVATFTSLYSSALNSGSLPSAPRASVDSHYNMSGGTNTSSPSASSHSAGRPSSSCGTSPEPTTQSPTSFKPVDTLTTIGEEQSEFSGTNQELATFGQGGMNDFNWLPQNNFQFDPNLFGDYREPQENVLSAGVDDGFFSDAFDIDFTQPYNAPLAVGPPPIAKKDLIAQIDEAKKAEECGNNSQFLDCNKIWEQLQSCPKVQSDGFDLDALCSDLKKKAKCSGTGPVVDEKNFHQVLEKHLGKCDGGLKSEAISSDNKA